MKGKLKTRRKIFENLCKPLDKGQVEEEYIQRILKTQQEKKKSIQKTGKQA